MSQRTGQQQQHSGSRAKERRRVDPPRAFASRKRRTVIRRPMSWELARQSAETWSTLPHPARRSDHNSEWLVATSSERSHTTPRIAMVDKTQYGNEESGMSSNTRGVRQRQAVTESDDATLREAGRDMPDWTPPAPGHRRTAAAQSSTARATDAGTRAGSGAHCHTIQSHADGHNTGEDTGRTPSGWQVYRGSSTAALCSGSGRRLGVPYHSHAAALAADRPQYSNPTGSSGTSSSAVGSVQSPLPSITISTAQEAHELVTTLMVGLLLTGFAIILLIPELKRMLHL